METWGDDRGRGDSWGDREEEEEEEGRCGFRRDDRRESPPWNERPRHHTHDFQPKDVADERPDSQRDPLENYAWSTEAGADGISFGDARGRDQFCDDFSSKKGRENEDGLCARRPPTSDEHVVRQRENATHRNGQFHNESTHGLWSRGSRARQPGRALKEDDKKRDERRRCFPDTSQNDRGKLLTAGRGSGLNSYRSVAPFRKNTFQLEKILGLGDTMEITLRITSSLEEFEEFLNAKHLPHHVIIDVLKLLSKASDCHFHGESVGKIVQAVCTSSLMDVHLTTLIHKLQDADMHEEEVVEAVELIHSLLSTICRKRPSYASKAFLLLTALTSGQPTVTAILRRKKPSLEEGLKDLLAESNSCMNMVSGGSARKMERSRFRRGPNEDDETPPEDFWKLPIFPGDRDMEWSDKPFLRANKEEGAYRDVSHYLDVHFRLLREDYIRPLRRGIQEFRKMKQTGERYRKLSDLRLYHGVQIVGAECKNSLEHRLQFDVSRLRNVKWQSSKRFTFGSLICLTLDDFDTRYFATVTDRDPKDLQKGIVQVKFEDDLEDILDCSSSGVFTLAETPGAFFEAYRHVLEGLQEFGTSPLDFPMSRYLVDCNRQVKPPAYLLKSPMPRVNVSSILDPSKGKDKDTGLQTIIDPSAVSAINPRSWPSVEQTVLNGPQLEAVQTALSKEVAIIQGPPGTGKTFVGLKVAKILLENRGIWTDPRRPKPMLVVCYTNHALDQFLEGILGFCPDGIVRVGSRSKSTKLKDFNLRSLRKKERVDRSTRSSLRKSIRDCMALLWCLKFQIEAVSSSLEASVQCIVKEDVLRPYMSAEHFKSLTSFCAYNERGDQRSVMVDWLLFGLLAGEGGGTGRDEIEEKTIDPSTVHTLPQKHRAQLYRVWLCRACQYLQHKVNAALQAGQYPQALMDYLDSARREILPDDVLKPVMLGGLYSAITSRMTSWNRHRKAQNPFCIRAWLGLSGSPKDFPFVQDILYPHRPDEEPGAIDDDTDEVDIDDEPDEMQSERRLDDDDDMFDNSRERPSLQAAICEISAVDRAGLNPKEAEATGSDRKAWAPQGRRDEGEWTVPQLQRMKQQRRILRLVRSSKPMTTDEAASIQNLWSPELRAVDRVRLYLLWVHAYQDKLRASMKSEALDYACGSRHLQELRYCEDLAILRKAEVIGMTTTGAARYRRVLAKVACPIVIIEEAAEVLEAHVVTTLHRECQHLILIGDHQQLRPSPTVYELCRRFNLDVSLFERLVNNHLPHATLAVQHRMRPEIARLVRHVYPHLVDHDSTEGREHIRGLKQDVFFFHHEVLEAAHDETSSKSNKHEAELCVSLCRYLLQQGYPPNSVTVLTAYTGQVLAVKDIMSRDKDFYAGVQVTAVDNYQGEENDIIILSLVRSNQEGSVGFLGTDNRVCVALSRARNGLYAIGNFKLLTNRSDLWNSVMQTAKQHGQYGEALVLRCENHPDNQVNASCNKDFDRVPEGGCQLPCGTRLERCGHVCRLLCHGYDKDHREYRCMKPCERKCPESHPCPRKCHEPCGPCLHPVQKTVPMCGHVETMACYKEPCMWRCAHRCQGTLPCGHQCSGKCGDCRERNGHVKECPEEVEKVWPCGHLVKSSCHVAPGALPCRHPCGVTLDCGHKCPGTCGTCWGGRVHVACKSRCGKTRGGCSHPCPLTCGTECLPCESRCRESCQHGRCASACGVPCTPCRERCPWECPHKKACRSLCCQPCPPCQKPCRKKLLHCSHRCRGLCGEVCVCSACDRKKFVALSLTAGGVVTVAEGDEDVKEMDQNTRLLKIPICGHVFRVDALDEYVDKALKSLPLGSLLSCPACPRKFILAQSIWRYSGLILERRVQQQEQAKLRLLESTSVSEERRKKIKASAHLLSEEASRALSIAESLQKRFNVNLASALTIQTKLVYVLERVLLSGTIQSELAEDLCILQKLLHRRMEFMTQQQFRQLTSETKRLLLKHLLLDAATCLQDDSEACRLRLRQNIEEEGKKMEDTIAGETATMAPSREVGLARTTDVMLAAAEKYGDVLRRIEVCQQALDSRHQDKLPEEDVKSIFNDCSEMGFSKFKNIAAASLSILNARPDQTLCKLDVAAQKEPPTPEKTSPEVRLPSRTKSLPPSGSGSSAHIYGAASVGSYKGQAKSFTRFNAASDGSRKAREGSWRDRPSSDTVSAAREGSWRDSPSSDTVSAAREGSWRDSFSSDTVSAAREGSWRDRPSSDTVSAAREGSWRDRPSSDTVSAAREGSWRDSFSSDTVSAAREGSWRDRPSSDTVSAAREGSWRDRPSSDTVSAAREGSWRDSFSSDTVSAAREGSWRDRPSSDTVSAAREGSWRDRPSSDTVSAAREGSWRDSFSSDTVSAAREGSWRDRPSSDTVSAAREGSWRDSFSSDTVSATRGGSWRDRPSSDTVSAAREGSWRDRPSSDTVSAAREGSWRDSFSSDTVSAAREGSWRDRLSSDTVSDAREGPWRDRHSTSGTKSAAAEGSWRDRPPSSDIKSPAIEGSWRNRPSSSDTKSATIEGSWRNRPSSSDTKSPAIERSWRNRPSSSDTKSAIERSWRNRPSSSDTKSPAIERTWRNRFSSSDTRSAAIEGSWRNRPSSSDTRSAAIEGSWRNRPSSSETKPAATEGSSPSSSSDTTSDAGEGSWRDGLSSDTTSDAREGSWRDGLSSDTTSDAREGSWRDGLSSDTTSDAREGSWRDGLSSDTTSDAREGSWRDGLSSDTTSDAREGSWRDGLSSDTTSDAREGSWRDGLSSDTTSDAREGSWRDGLSSDTTSDAREGSWRDGLSSDTTSDAREG